MFSCMQIRSDYRSMQRLGRFGPVTLERYCTAESSRTRYEVRSTEYGIVKDLHSMHLPPSTSSSGSASAHDPSTNHHCLLDFLKQRRLPTSDDSKPNFDSAGLQHRTNLLPRLRCHSCRSPSLNVTLWAAWQTYPLQDTTMEDLRKTVCFPLADDL